MTFSKVIDMIFKNKIFICVCFLYTLYHKQYYKIKKIIIFLENMMKKFNEQRNVIGNLIKEYREKKNYTKTRFISKIRIAWC